MGKYGTTYSTGGTYVLNGTNAAGCPNADTLILTINVSTHSSTLLQQRLLYLATNGNYLHNWGTYILTVQMLPIVQMRIHSFNHQP